MKWLCLAGLLLTASAFAEDGMLYGYANHTSPRTGSVLNPGNQIARLSQNSSTLESRLNFKAENDQLRFTARPILFIQNNTYNNQYDAYFSQWQMRLRASDTWSISAGREVLNWGPAQFRSPSSPFYFDNGRSNPMRELSGVDALKLSWNPDMQRTLTLAHLTGHVAQNTWRNSDLLKADQRGDDWAGGLALAQRPGQGLFAGLHGQYTLNDALLLYGEASSSTLASSLQSPADPGLPFSLTPRSSRQTDMLAGAAWTFDSGQSLNAEYLHEGHGYRTAEQSAYFQRAAALPLNAALALAYAPPLLGRDYLHLVWQSNLMESGGYWRWMATHSFTDGGHELSGYAESALTPHVTAFMLGVLPVGNAQQEFSSLYRYSLNAGLKISLP